jgi:hypothetical protein
VDTLLKRLQTFTLYMVKTGLVTRKILFPQKKLKSFVGTVTSWEKLEAVLNFFLTVVLTEV